MTQSKNKNFFLASIVGALAGAVGALLLAPKSGLETRKDIINIATKISNELKENAANTKKRVEEVFGEATDAAKLKYQQVQTSLSTRIASLKKAGQEIDKEKYSKVVDDIIIEFKSDLDATKDGAKKMALLLKKDWLKIKKALA